VTGPDVPDRDMPNFTWPSCRDAPVISDAALAALLAREQLPPGSAPELQPLARMLADLAGRPASDELEGEAGTLAAFRNQFSAAASVRRPHRHRPRLRTWRLRVEAAAAAAAILSIGGLATAAYAGVLPADLQRIAHNIIGAPETGTQLATRPSQAGEAATDQPGYGLCTAWAHVKAHGTRKQQARAFSELATAAGGPGSVAAYCATAEHPRTSPSHRPHPAPAPRGSGRPGGLPTPRGSGRPSVLPTPRGSGRPSVLPTPRGSGRPSVLPTPRGSGKPSVLPTPRGSGKPSVVPARVA
jgi:hypothetical protein